jgi:hypothetical protein
MSLRTTACSDIKSARVRAIPPLPAGVDEEGASAHGAWDVITSSGGAARGACARARVRVRVEECARTRSAVGRPPRSVYTLARGKTCACIHDRRSGRRGGQRACVRAYGVRACGCGGQWGHERWQSGRYQFGDLAVGDRGGPTWYRAAAAVWREWLLSHRALVPFTYRFLPKRKKITMGPSTRLVLNFCAGFNGSYIKA